eukprot:Plantae.Rhodophyta-Hildenbrandia_rubra.ctg2282.p1 GENE.Plantae.Rhodophyta-Hildenbrandia_rubra.ctg2282~~Plantae.Rhodophyta-Hildenbrandia_rubra.ctg2282.p1  ORF type:complete len:1002 (+),score=124.41 Plantae.Rhodophyta-Hildenbrandia_rubra.ctg2282:4508-7513(+)
MTFPSTSTPDEHVTQEGETPEDRRKRRRRISQQRRRARMSEEAKEEKKRKDREQKRKKRQEEQGIPEATNVGVSLLRKRNHSTSIANASTGENPQSHQATREGRFRVTDTEVQTSLAPVPTEDGGLRSQLPRRADTQQQQLFLPPGERLSNLPAPPSATELALSSPSFSSRQQLLPSMPVENRIIPTDPVTSGTRSIMSPLDVFASAPEMPVPEAPGNSVVPFPPSLAREEHAMARIQVAAGTLHSDFFNDSLHSILLDEDSALNAAFDHLTSLVMKISWITERCSKKQLKGLLRDFDVATAALEKREIGKDGESLEALRLVKGALKASPFALSKDHGELAFQLTGRLLSHVEDNLYIQNFLDEVHKAQVEPWLCPLAQYLESPTSSKQIVLHTDSSVESVACVGRGDNVVIAYSTSYGDGYVWNGSNQVCLRQTDEEHIDFVDVGSIVAAVCNKNIHIYDIETGYLRGICVGHDIYIASMAVAKRGNVIVSGTRDGGIKFWSIKSAKCVGDLREHDDCVNSVAIADDGSFALSGSSDCTIRMWDVNSKRCTRVFKHWARVDCVKFASNRNLMVSQSTDCTLQLWNRRGSICEIQLRHEGGFLKAVADNGTIVLSGSEEGIEVRDTRSGWCKIVTQLDSAAALVDDGSAAVLGSGSTIRMWNLGSTELVGNDDWYRKCQVKCAANNEDIAISGWGDGAIRVWDIASGMCTKVLEGHSGPVRSVALSGDSTVAVSGSCDNTVRIWNVTLGMCQKTLEGHEDAVSSVALTKQGGVVVSGSDDKAVRVWDVTSGECKHILHGHTSVVKCVAVTADGSVALSGGPWHNSYTDRILVWDASTGERRHIFDIGEFSARLYSLAVTECGKLALSLSYYWSIQVWDVERGQRLCALELDDLMAPEERVERFPKWLEDQGSLLAWAHSSGLLANVDRQREGVPPLHNEDVVKYRLGKITIQNPNGDMSNLSATFDEDVKKRPFINFEKNRVLVVCEHRVCILAIVDPRRR